MDRRANPSLAEVIRRVDQLRRILKESSDPGSARDAALRSELTRLLQVAGVKPGDFDFGSTAANDAQTFAAPETSISRSAFETPTEEPGGLTAPDTEGSYPQPSQREEYLMRLFGFDSLREMEEWMNRPSSGGELDDPYAGLDMDEIFEKLRERTGEVPVEGENADPHEGPLKHASTGFEGYGVATDDRLQYAAAGPQMKQTAEHSGVLFGSEVARVIRTQSRLLQRAILLVGGGLLILMGWMLLAHTASIALAILGCPPSALESIPGGTICGGGASPGEKNVIQIIGMAFIVGGAISALTEVTNRGGA